MWYIYIGIGVYLAFLAIRSNEIKKEPFISILLGLLLTIILWPFALYNNLKL